MKKETFGKILAVNKKWVRIKVSNDDALIFDFAISEDEHQMYLDKLNQNILVTSEVSLDKIKFKLYH